MRVWTQFDASGYATHHGEFEQFPSLRAAARAIRERVGQQDRRFPCVPEDARLIVWLRDPMPEIEDHRDPYPDCFLAVGPRGGIVRGEL
jgi:hypothetical protein